jgi:NAD(P)-dependent dehydrogenase (short-subunit alcohol dehydrogenase family)
MEYNASIIIIGSTAGKFGEAYHADYAATKSALMYGFLRSLKNEIVKIVPRGRANCVAPG